MSYVRDSYRSRDYHKGTVSRGFLIKNLRHYKVGRLQMTNVVFSALSTFYLCTFKLQDTVIKEIDKYIKHYLLRGSDVNAKTPPKLAWEMVYLPKSEGGLEVINLSTHNDAMLQSSQILQ
jgi:hypothetical protein